MERVRAQLEQVRVVPEEAQQRARQIEQWRQEAAQMWVAVASIKRARNESNYSPAVQPEAVRRPIFVRVCRADVV